MSPREVEVRRQQRLWAALQAASSTTGAAGWPEGASRGLRAYRANAGATAQRALAAACPTLQAMLGERDFAALAREYWRAEPPVCGDLGEWGDGLPAWIAQHAALAEWPWLADCTRLDLALHRCERAADGEFDAVSLARLGDTPPEDLRIELAAGCALIASPFPIVRIHAAHAGHGEDGFAAVREALARGQGEAAFVARNGWRATVRAVDAAEAAWLRGLIAGRSLDESLAAALPRFDFTAWLQEALRMRWLKGIAALADG